MAELNYTSINIKIIQQMPIRDTTGGKKSGNTDQSPQNPCSSETLPEIHRYNS